MESNDNPQIQCTSCNRITTKDELIKENGELLDIHMEDMKEEVLKDVEKEIKNALKDAFKGLNNVKLR